MTPDEQARAIWKKHHGASLQPRFCGKVYVEKDIALAAIKEALAYVPSVWQPIETHPARGQFLVDAPDVFQRRAELSRQIGAKLVRYQGKRIQLDELPADAKGRNLKSLKMPECGILCEERPINDH